MADILSQDEIDALLSTVSDDSGGGDGDTGGGGDDFDDFGPDFVPKKISVYDFRRPDRVSYQLPFCHSGAETWTPSTEITL